MDESGKHIYYELHRPSNQASSHQFNKEQMKQSSSSKRIGIFIVLLLVLVLILLGITLVLTALMFTSRTLAVDNLSNEEYTLQKNEVAWFLGKITKSVMSQTEMSFIEATQNITETVNSLCNIADQQLSLSQNNTNAVKNLIRLLDQQLSLSQNNTDAVKNLIRLLDQQLSLSQNNTDEVKNVIRLSSENATQKLINIISTLNNLKGTSISTDGVVDDILLVVEELLKIQNTSVLFNAIQPVSCKDIKTVLPNSPTGYYHVNSRNIYCNMGELCGTGGGWTRLAYLDMSDSTVNCPTGFRLYQSGGVRACGRAVSSGASCSSFLYPSNGISYSQICGRVVGYQYGTPDGIFNHNINTNYVDGVSITHGSPRQHVWTLICGWNEKFGSCPCSSNPSVPFVGSNYFCESGNNNGYSYSLFTGDPLWDGQGCGGGEASCCSAPGLPWFHRDYGNVTTTDYIELRLCGNEPTSNEDTPVSFYEIYIQ